MLYQIEIYYDFDDTWHTLLHFSFMRKTFADGAWAMLKSMYNSGEKFQLVDENSKILDEWVSAKVKPNGGRNMASCVLDALNLHGFIFREIDESDNSWRERLRSTYGIFDYSILNALSLALTANKDKEHDDDN